MAKTSPSSTLGLKLVGMPVVISMAAARLRGNATTCEKQPPIIVFGPDCKKTMGQALGFGATVRSKLGVLAATEKTAQRLIMVLPPIPIKLPPTKRLVPD